MTYAQYLSSQFPLIQYIDFVFRLIVACLCGAVIGVERIRRLKEAGIRTHVIVCCAAALTMIISKYGFADLTDAAGMAFSGTREADPARIAAQAISGVSFLGAGVIFKHGSTIRGLTTAAGIWATAVIGLAVGSGMYVIGILSTALIIIVQFIMHRFTYGLDAMVMSQIQFTTQELLDFLEQLSSCLNDQNIQILNSEVTRNDNGSVTYDIYVRSAHPVTVDVLTDFMKANACIENATCSRVS